MAARIGLTRDDVVDAAVALLDEGARPEALTLGALARRLGIRPQSLYAHVDGADGLARALALRGLHELAERVTEAAIGRSGVDALEGIVRAQLAFAVGRPGLYAASIHPPGDDTELLVAIERVNRPLQAVLSSFGLDEREQIHSTRLILASVYGYALLRRDGQLTLAADADHTADRLVGMIVGQVSAAGESRRCTTAGMGL